MAPFAELGAALSALGMEGKNFGEYTLSVVIYDEDRLKVENAVAEFQKLFTQHDGLLYEERYNLLNAFLPPSPATANSICANSGYSTPTMQTCRFCSRWTLVPNGIRISNASTSPFWNPRTARPIT
jgi:type IV secretory pathway VirB4 component